MRTSAIQSTVAIGCLTIVVLLVSRTAEALDNENLVISVGLKAWDSTWSSWRPETVFFNNGPIKISQPLKSDSKIALIPSLSVAIARQFLVSASYLTPTNYPLNGALDTNSLVGSRKEFDASVGYYLLPGLALSIGYKDIEQAYGQGTYKWTGAIAILGGSAPFSAHWALYGSAAYSPMTLRLPAASADAAGNTSFNATYALGEFGVAYTIGRHSILESMRITLGYRYQLLNTRGYVLNTSGALVSPVEQDYTQGVTLGVLASF